LSFRQFYLTDSINNWLLAQKSASVIVAFVNGLLTALIIWILIPDPAALYTYAHPSGSMLTENTG
jgi:hypothetical protein